MATAPVWKRDGDLAAVGFERVDGLVGDVERIGCGLAAFEEDEVLGVDFAVAGDVDAVRDDVGVEAGDDGDSGGGVNVSGGNGVEVLDGELGVEGGGGGGPPADRWGRGFRRLRTCRLRVARRLRRRESRGLGRSLEPDVEVVVDLGDFSARAGFRGSRCRL